MKISWSSAFMGFSRKGFFNLFPPITTYSSYSMIYSSWYTISEFRTDFLSMSVSEKAFLSSSTFVFVRIYSGDFYYSAIYEVESDELN